jgi:hypothetical protein
MITRARTMLLLGLLGNVPLLGCVYKPWGVHSATDAKPTSPLVAPANQATLVVVVSNPQHSGNGRYTVFEGEEPVAQIDETIAA